MNCFYVYEWYIKDTMEVFYVGKGKGERYLETRRRNKMFKDIYSTHKCGVRKIKEGLTEQEAFELEVEKIKYYRENTTYRLSNQTVGGAGGNTRKYYSKEQLEEYSIRASKKRKGLINQGENNPMYGKSWVDNKSEDEIREIIEKIRKSNIGKKRSAESRAKMSISAKKRENNLKPKEKRPCVIVKKDTFELVQMYDGITFANGNDYVKGNLSRKASGLCKNEKEDYLIFYTYYNIDGRDSHPKL